MNYKFHLLFLCAFCFHTQLFSQTVIGKNFDINNLEQRHLLLTKTGDQLLGQVIFIRNDTVGFQIRNLADTSFFLLPDIRFIGSAEQLNVELLPTQQLNYDSRYKEVSERDDFPMPKNNLLYSATALPISNRGSYRNTMVLINVVDRQFSQNFTLGAGFVLPVVLTARAQAKKSLSDFIHMGVAFQFYQILVDEQRSSHSYAILTVGDQEKYLNFTYGYWVDRFSGFNDSREVSQIVTIGGSFAFAESWRFYAEAGIVYNDFDGYVLPSFNFTNHRRRNTFEFGVLAIPETTVPLLPLFTYYRSF